VRTTSGFDDPKAVMNMFADWLDQNSKGRPVFVSDNLAFDWQFINCYFHAFSAGILSDFRGAELAIFTPAW